jgi:hypothetical protein
MEDHQNTESTIKLVHRTVARCTMVREALSSRVELMQKVILWTRVATSLVGSSALIVVFANRQGAQLPSQLPDWLSYAAAILLTATAFLTGIIEQNSPAAMKNFIRYIRHYEEEMFAILAIDDKTPSIADLERLRELMRMARKNLEEAYTEWPWCEKKANKALVTPATAPNV